MKIREKYDEMSNEDLFAEMLHRYEAFGDNLGGYQDGGLSIPVELLKHKLSKDAYVDEAASMFLDEVRKEDASLIFCLADDIYYDDSREDMIKISKGDLEYRACLIRCLSEKYILYNACSFDKVVDQQHELQITQCYICKYEKDPTKIIAEHLLCRDDDTEEFVLPQDCEVKHTAFPND